MTVLNFFFKDTSTRSLIPLHSGTLDLVEVQKLADPTNNDLEEALVKARQSYLGASICFDLGEGGKYNG